MRPVLILLALAACDPDTTVGDRQDASPDAANMSDAATLQLSSPEDVVLDESSNRALVIDSVLDALVAVDLTSGAHTIVSDGAVGSGTALEFPYGVTLDSANVRALVTDLDLLAVVEIDLTSGDRSIVSDGSTGAGPYLLQGPVDIAMDMTANRVLVFDSVPVAIDLATGDREVISDASIGVGPLFSNIQAGALDSLNGRVLIADHGLEALIAVDLVSGDRTIISDDSTGAGPPLTGPRDLTLDTTNNRVLVVIVHDIAGVEPALLAIDLDTGNRTIISDSSTGSGPEFSAPLGIALDTANNRALVSDVNLGALIAVDLASGDRTIFGPR